jgi:hypothetical protein
MTDLEAELLRLKTKRDLAHFSLSNCKNSSHRLILDKSIEDLTREVDRLEAWREAVTHG